jgi:hypothetical protein
MTSVRIAGLEDFHALRARWMALVAEGDFAAAFELVEAATA